MLQGRFNYNIRRRVGRDRYVSDGQLGRPFYATLYHEIDLMTWTTRNLTFSQLYGPMVPMITGILEALKNGGHPHSNQDVDDNLHNAMPLLNQIKTEADALAAAGDDFPVHELYTIPLDPTTHPERASILAHWTGVNAAMAPYACIPFVGAQDPGPLVGQTEMDDHMQYFADEKLENAYRYPANHDGGRYRVKLREAVAAGILSRTHIEERKDIAPGIASQPISAKGNEGKNNLVCGANGCDPQPDSFCNTSDNGQTCSAASGG